MKTFAGNVKKIVRVSNIHEEFLAKSRNYQNNSLQKVAYNRIKPCKKSAAVPH